MRLLLPLFLLVSCQQSFIFTKSENIDQMLCTEVKNCSSSLNKELDDYIPPFKMLGDSATENMENIERASKKYGLSLVEKSGEYLHLATNGTHLEFFIDPENKYILVKAQVISTDWLGRKSFDSVESIRFDFFQKNY